MLISPPEWGNNQNSRIFSIQDGRGGGRLSPLLPDSSEAYPEDRVELQVLGREGEESGQHGEAASQDADSGALTLEEEKFYQEFMAQKFGPTDDTVLRFEKNEITERMIVKIVDKETGETVSQIPPEEYYKVVESIFKAREAQEKRAEQRERAAEESSGSSGDSSQGRLINETV